MKLRQDLDLHVLKLMKEDWKEIRNQWSTLSTSNELLLFRGLAAALKSKEVPDEVSD